MKKYFSAILLGSLFSCPVFPIGIVDEPDILVDCSSEPDLITVNYESYDRAHEHHLVHLTWTDFLGNTWSQRGRLARLKRNFHYRDRTRLMNLRSVPKNENDTRQIFYFLEGHKPCRIEQPPKVRVRYCPLNAASKKKKRKSLKERSNNVLSIDGSSDAEISKKRKRPLLNEGPNKISVINDNSDSDITVERDTSEDVTKNLDLD